MKRFAKIILVIAGGVLALFLVALVGVNLYLQSGDVQQRIRLVTEQALGTPVTVTRTLYTPWNGLTLSGLSLADPTVAGANLMDAPTFSVQFEFFPLLAKKFVISEVNLASPHLVLRQTADRRWILIPPRISKPSPRPAPETGVTAPSMRLPNYSVELRRYTVDDGRAEIMDYHGSIIGRLSGLNIVGTVTTNRVVEGDLEVDNLEIGEQLFPRHLKAHFKQERAHLAVTEIRCSLADGKIHAELHIVANRKSPPDFQLKGDVKDISIPMLIAQASGNDTGTTGTLNGEFQLRGNPLDDSSLVGHGDFSLDAAQLRPWDAIQQIGMLFRVDELQMLKLHQATMKLDVRDKHVYLTDLTFKTDNLIITGKGPIRFDGKMNIASRLMVNQKIQRELEIVGLMNERFTPSEDANYKQVAFNVTGRIDRPKVDLLEKVTGIKSLQLGAIGGILKGFFSAPKPAPVETTPSPAGN